jgi:hypothetical protein
MFPGVTHAGLDYGKDGWCQITDTEELSNRGGLVLMLPKKYVNWLLQPSNKNNDAPVVAFPSSPNPIVADFASLDNRRDNQAEFKRAAITVDDKTLYLSEKDGEGPLFAVIIGRAGQSPFSNSFQENYHQRYEACVFKIRGKFFIVFFSGPHEDAFYILEEENKEKMFGAMALMLTKDFTFFVNRGPSFDSAVKVDIHLLNE